MNLLQSIKLAVRALGANKLRAGLTMLGMIIGVGAVIALMSIGRGIQASITAQISGLGANLLFIVPGAQSQNGVRQQAGTTPTLTYEDAMAIGSQVDEALAVAPEAATRAQVVANGLNTSTTINGVTPNYLSIRNLSVADGDFLTREHLDARSGVAVLGSSAKQTLFGDADAIDQPIRINQVTVHVIGVLEPRGGQGFTNQDDVIFVPITTLQSRFNRSRTTQGGTSVTTVYVQLADEKQATADAATEHISELLRERHRVQENDFTVLSQTQLLATTSTITGIFTVFLGAVAGISLLVGGIGIMNIMLVSVTERTREIGIRKAVGAKRRHILTQFLIEALVVAVAGGTIGIILGSTGATLISLVRVGGQPLQTRVGLDAIALAVTVSSAIGLCFGVFPAVKAARLNPIDALRYE